MLPVESTAVLRLYRLRPIAKPAGYRQAMVLAKGDWTQFFTRPISCVLLVIAIGTLLINGYKEVKHNWLGAPKKTEEAKAE